MDSVSRLLHSVRPPVEPRGEAVERDRRDIIGRLRERSGEIALEVLRPLKEFMERHVEQRSAHTEVAVENLERVLPEAVRELGERLEKGETLRNAVYNVVSRYEGELYRNIVDAETGEWLKRVFMKTLARAPMIAARRVYDETERLAMYRGDEEVLDAARSSLIHALRGIYGKPKNMPRYAGRVLELYDVLK